jgi:hypothetical protein
MSAADDSASDSCLAAVWRGITLDMLNPETPFLIFLRKLSLVVVGWTGPLAALFFISRVYLLFIGEIEANVPLYVSFVYSNIMMWGYGVPYMYAMKTGNVTGLLNTIQFYSGATAGTCIMLVNPSWPAALCAALLAVLCAMTAAPGAPGFYVFCVFAYVLSTYNNAALVTGGTPIAFEGYPSTNIVQVFFNGISLLPMVVMLTVGVRMQGRHSGEMLKAANAANELSRSAAELLRHYDTDGVSLLLTEYRELPGADPELLDSYTALVVNLNLYRAHLPNWLVNRDLESDDDAADRAEAGLEPDSRCSPLFSAPNSATRAQRGDVNAIPPPPSAFGQAAAFGQSRSRRLSPGESMNGSFNAGVPGLLLAEPKQAHIAFARIDFRATPGAASAATSRFAECVHQVAATTHCALHSFVGDTVQLSWNAATRAAQPEVKAVRFLIRLAAAVAPIDGIVVSGAAMSGKATTQFAGTERVKAFAVSIPWRNALSGLTTFARKHRTFVVDEATAAEANSTCELRSVEVLRFDERLDVANNLSQSVVVKEVLNEREDQCEEWMYALEKSNTVDPVSAVLNKCIAGNYGDAVAALEKLAVGTPLVAPTLLHLRDRALAGLRHAPAQFAEPVCACTL